MKDSRDLLVEQRATKSQLSAGDFVLKLSRGNKIGFSVIFGGYILGAISLGIKVLFFDCRSDALSIALVVWGFGLLGIAPLVEVFKYRVEKIGDRLSTISLFAKRTLLKEEIESFKILQQHYVIFMPKEASGKKVLRVPRMMADLAKLLDWARSNFEDAGEAEARELDRIAFASMPVIATEQQKIAELGRIRRIFRILQGAILTVCAWGWFFASFKYRTLIALLVVCPFAVIGFLKKFPGAVRMDSTALNSTQKAAYPLILSMLTLFIRGLLDFNLTAQWPVFLTAIPIALAVSILIYWVDVDPRKKIWSILVMMLFTEGYSYGLLVEANVLLDRSQERVYSASILKKNAEGGKSHRYLLRLSPWGPVSDSKDIQVWKGFFDSVVVNEKIELLLHDGKLGFPWFGYRKQSSQ